MLVLIANSFAFSTTSLLASRTVLFLALALAFGAGLLIPLLRLNSRRAAREAEKKFPEFEQRLLTFTEKSNANASDPFLELLAADTLEAARSAEPARVTTQNAIIGFASAAIVAVTVLIWLGMAGPGFWGYGTALLWAGPPKAAQQAFYDIVIEPGNRTVRKKSDQLVTARMVGFTVPSAKLFAKYNSVAKWEEAAMRPQAGSPNHEFLFSGVPETLEYYVEAGGVRSKTYKLNVIDLPGVKKIRVTYHYPTWSGMKDATEDPGGDLRAVEGTTADVTIETDRPLPNGVILLDDDTRIPLKNGVARVPIQKDGLYHIASVEKGVEHGIGQDEDVRLSDDYFIEARKDTPPNVRISKPGRDAKANPVEEVPVQIEADDDFGLQDVSLRYSVNGGPEKTVPVANVKGQKTAEGKTLLSLEDFKLVPGDIVSMYATAKDARNTTQTDMFFIEAQPFEREYSQSQQGGGGGGGGGGDDSGQNNISKRQKEIIAATWNQIKDTKANKATAAETAKFLADMQAKLKEQAQSLAERMKSRDLAGTNQEFQKFVKAMEAAVAEMGPASDKLKSLQWKDARPLEEKALQHLLRAEAVFRQIQVAFGQRGGGGGGGGGGAGRDLELVRSRARHGEESVREQSAVGRRGFGRSAQEGNRRGAAEAGSAGAAAAGVGGSAAEESAAGVPAAVSAGDVAPRGGAIASADGTAHPPARDNSRVSKGNRVSRASKGNRVSKGNRGNRVSKDSKGNRASPDSPVSRGSRGSRAGAASKDNSSRRSRLDRRSSKPRCRRCGSKWRGSSPEARGKRSSIRRSSS